MVNAPKRFLIMLKQSATDAFKTVSKREFQRTVEAAGYLIGNKVANKITGVSKNSEAVESVKKKIDKEIPKERYIYLQKKDRKLLII